MALSLSTLVTAEPAAFPFFAQTFLMVMAVVVFAATVTAHVAVLFPSAVFTVIVALPALTPVITPLALTFATLALLLDQVTFLFDASLGLTVAVSVLVDPTFSVAEVGLTDTPVTEIDSAVFVVKLPLAE